MRWKIPELPEVETIVRSLRPHLEGRTIACAIVVCARISRGQAPQMEAALPGRRIESLERFGKYLYFQLDSGSLAIHLGMTGQLLLNATPGPYTRAQIHFHSGPSLLFNDIRRFGRIEFSTTFPPHLNALGPDAATVPFPLFWERLQSRRTRLKALLLDQTFLRGLGNIYTDEALFRARLHPLRPTQSLTRPQARHLHAQIVSLLQEAIVHRGSSISDYVDHQGQPGSFQLFHQVYAKTGEPCPNCGTALERIVLQQRGTHLCPRCQRL